MASQFPSLDTVRERLQGLSHAQLQTLAKASGVPFTTLWKIRNGPTTNPGVETVRAFWSHLPERRHQART